MNLLIFLFFIAGINCVVSIFVCRNLLKKNRYKVDFIVSDFSDINNMRKLKRNKKEYVSYYNWLISSIMIVIIIFISFFFAL